MLAYGGLASDNEILSCGYGECRRGWLDERSALGGNIPHNWIAAEIMYLIRDIFVTEEEGGLVLGRGVPETA